MILISFNSS